MQINVLISFNLKIQYKKYDNQEVSFSLGWFVAVFELSHCTGSP